MPNITTAGTDPNAAPWYATALTSLTAVYQQTQVNKINLQRAQQGLPPLDPSATSPTVNVGMPTGQLNKILMLGGAALAVVLFVSMRRGR
jgi:hypothetical protein